MIICQICRKRLRGLFTGLKYRSLNLLSNKFGLQTEFIFRIITQQDESIVFLGHFIEFGGDRQRSSEPMTTYKCMDF